jgi:phosphinothricin acetyltransferase
MAPADWLAAEAIYAQGIDVGRVRRRQGRARPGDRARIARSGAGPHAGQWRDTVLIERRGARHGTR